MCWSPPKQKVNVQGSEGEGVHLQSPSPSPAPHRSSDYGRSKLNGDHETCRTYSGSRLVVFSEETSLGSFVAVFPSMGEDTTCPLGAPPLSSLLLSPLAVPSGPAFGCATFSPTVTTIHRQGLGTATRRQHRRCQSTRKPQAKKTPRRS